MIEKLEMELGGRTISVETGRVAKQAHGAVWMQYGETIVLVAVLSDRKPQSMPFFPLMVDYREKTYAGGRIPGNFFKREGAPNTTEKLSCRLIDHPIRSAFPKDFAKVAGETQVLVTVLSFDQENDPAVLALNGASAALSISDIPFNGPIAAVRVGRVDGEVVINPTYEQIEDGEMGIVVTGNRESIVAVEGECHEVAEADVLEALELAHQSIVKLIDWQDELVTRVGVPKREVVAVEIPEGLAEAVLNLAKEGVHQANRTEAKEDRAALLGALEAEVKEKLAEEYPDNEGDTADAFDAVVKADMRGMILDEGQRIDGRAIDEVRQISIELGVIPRAHGSALFTRGQTQALCVTTLGTKMDTRMVDDLEGKSFKSFMLDYNFPSYSVGETRRIGPPGRREIGHGALAERALDPAIPSDDSFPYTIRVVSEILEANSSSSMATVCGGSLSLMDAGVPIKTAVAGAGVGLVIDGDRHVVLTDILGDEDHLGDMDLKIAGTSEGITSIQMDIKVSGIPFEIMKEAFGRARQALNHILGLMTKAIEGPREELSQHAPRILAIRIDPSKIGIVIGPGGKTIRSIEETGATVSVEDDGMVTVSAVDAGAGEEAMGMIQALVEDPEIDRVYTGKVKRVMDFGAFIEILPGKEGLCHISELDHHRVQKVEDVLNEGDTTEVKVIAIDDVGKIRLSRKVLIEVPEGFVPEPARDGDDSRSRGRGRRRPDRR
jgi:polyribonucleotide nucleotidyltransferase